MSWLNSFDPAAPKSSGATGYRDSYADNGSQRYIQPSSTPTLQAGPSTARPNTAAPRPPMSGLHHTGRTTCLYLPPASDGPSSSAFLPRPRPRPPQRIKAAPPSAALRSEDAQPNENEARTKPWEIAAPPSIGKSKSSMPPPRGSRQPQPQQQRFALPPRPCAASQTSASRSNLPQRPPQQQAKTKLHPRSQARPQSQSGPKPQPIPKLSKKQRKKLKQREQQQVRSLRQQDQQDPNTPTHPGPPPAKRSRLDEAASQASSTSSNREKPQELLSQQSNHDSQMSVSIRKPSPPSVASTQPRASAAEPAPKDSPAESRSSARASPHGRINTPTLSQLQGILAMVSNSPEKSGSSQQQPKPVKTETVEQARVPGEGGRIGEAMSADHARIAEQDQVVRQAEQAQLAEQARKDQHACQAEEARQAEEQVLCLEQLQDDESAASASEEPAPLKLTPKQVSESLTSGSKKLGAAVTTKSESVGEDELREEKPAVANAPTKRGEADDVGDTGEDDEDDRPLAEALYAFRDIAQSSLHSRAQHLDNADSDPEEDVPLQDLLQRRSSEAPSGANSVDNASKWPSTPFEPKITRLYSAAPGISIRHFVPIASSALEAQRTIVRNPAAVFDAGVAVSEFGKIATFSEKPIKRSLECEELFPGKMMEFRSDVEGKAKSIKGSGGIDRVEDVRRLTSKVCGIASSTKKPLGLGNHADYPCQVSLVTVNEIGRAHRTYHLDEQPHAWGVASISHFPRTDPLDASSIDFATGGIDGIVNHWHWRARSTNAQTFRLHTLHDANPVVALEHLSSRANVLASASIGTVVGYDLAALTLGFSWNTSDHIVHLQRTPDTKLMLGVMARRDYDQFRMFDVTGRNGPISRPVISFGWLNDSEGKLPLGRGSFHPTRRAIFAHGAEDGRIRVWDMRNARDPLIDVRLGDEPIVEAVWGRGGSEEGAGDAEDLLYVASPKGVRSVSLLAP